MENLRDLEIEEGKETEMIPPWTSHITIRGLVASIVIGIIYSVIVMKLNLTTGFAPNFNVSAAFVAFAFIRSWTMLLHKAGFVSRPFTKQENTVIQTCAVACYSIAFGGTHQFNSDIARMCFVNISCYLLGAIFNNLTLMKGEGKSVILWPKT